MPRQRRLMWLLIVAAAIVAIVSDVVSQGRVEGPMVYVLAVLPGAVAFLAWRSLLASAVVTLAPVYFLIDVFNRSRPAHAPALALDRALPVAPPWMLVYGSLYVFVVVLPLLVVRERALGRRAMQAYLAVMVVSYAGFLLYPTIGPRPPIVPGGDFAAWCLRLVYSLDAPYNCFPSLHVAYAFVAALICDRVNRSVGIVAIAWATLIGISTLYTKQHYVADVMAGAVEGWLACALFLRGYPRSAVADTDRRLAPRRAMIAVGIFAAMVAGFWIAFTLETFR